MKLKLVTLSLLVVGFLGTGGIGAESFNVPQTALAYSAENLQPDRVNVFHFTIHPGEFSPDEINGFLTSAVDPLVEQGLVHWATYSQMADAFRLWEQFHPGQDPRQPAEFP